MKPITRKELYLNKIVGNDDYDIPEKPITIEEFFFVEILGEAVQAPEPLTRYQKYLAKIAKKDVEIPYPETRLEYFLARAAGMDIETPTPITREEIFWSNYTAIVELEVEGVPPLTYKAIEGTLTNYRIYGPTSRNLFDGSFIHRAVLGAIVSDNDPNRHSTVVDVSNFNNGDKITFSRETSAGDRFQMYQVNSPLKGGWLLETNVITGNPETLLATITLDDISNYHYLMIFLNSALNPITDEELLASKIMINVGNTPLPYEPYGESVGDRTGNFFYKKIENANISSRGGVYTDVQYNLWIGKVTAGETYTAHNIDLVVGFFTDEPDYGVYTYNNSRIADASLVYTFTVPSGCSYVAIRFLKNEPTIMLNSGATPLPYEPYGYKVPVTVSNGTDSQIVPIYLPEQIKKVGDEAEYIDYAQQKQYFADGTETDVTLPALPTLPGTNVLSVGTEVQPSKVYVKYKEERQ